jgi:hypothetical protein
MADEKFKCEQCKKAIDDGHYYVALMILRGIIYSGIVQEQKERYSEIGISNFQVNEDGLIIKAGKDEEC